MAIGALLMFVPAHGYEGKLRLWHVRWYGAWLCVAGVAIGIGVAWWARLHLGRLWSAHITRKTDHENRGRPLKAAALADLEPLNRLLARDEGFGQLVVHKQGKITALKFQSARHWRSPDSLLLPIGEARARMLAEEDLSDVKACEGATCTLMFADRTRGRSRRWCSMGSCGNRAKQIAHRLRLKDSR